MLIANTA